MTQPLTILFFARHYPPHVTGAARRLSGLTRELRSLGHRVIVAAPSLVEDEDGVRVHHAQPVPTSAPEHEPSPSQQVRGFARRWLLWPDADIRWTRRAVQAMQPFATQADWVFTSSPPESCHAAGMMMKRQHGLLWAADFRDLWLERPLRPELSSPLRRVLEGRWARRVASLADLLTGVDTFIADETNRFAGKSGTLVLPHAADPPSGESFDFEAGAFHLVHTGSFTLSDPDRRIEPLISAFETVAARAPQLRLHLIGRLTDIERSLVTASSAAGQIMLHGIVDHLTAVAMQHGASALALVGSPASHVPPGKFVEYRALAKPIIVFGPARWRSQINPEADAASALLNLVTGTTTGDSPTIDPPPRHAEIAARLSAEMMEVMARRDAQSD